MNFEILDKKAVVDGHIDLLSSICIIDYERIAIDEWILVDEFTQMGLDAISDKLYGSNEYTWLLVKFNRLSNPLEVNIGDIIAVPNIQDFRKYSKFVDREKVMRKDLQTQTKAFNTLVNTSSAVKKVPASNFVKKSGNVIF